jgi:hypothetical protein
LTLDGGGGAYTGGVLSSAASSVTISSAPFQKPSTGTYQTNYNLSDWEGAAVLVLEGRGAGQWRRVAGTRGPKGSQVSHTNCLSVLFVCFPYS